MSRLPDADRAVIAALADALIPEAEGMPCATAVGAAEQLLDQILNVQPELAPDLMQVARAASGTEPRCALETLRLADPERYEALTLAVAAAYYLSPAVRNLLGYTGPERRSFDPDAVPDYIADGLLAPVIARGPLWRRPPIV